MFDKDCPECKRENTNIEVERFVEICANCGYEHPDEATESAAPSGQTDFDLLTDNEGSEEQELNKGHYHEIIDRGHIVCSMIDDFLIDHPGMTKEMNQLCEEAQSKLYRVTNLACGEEDRNFGG